MKALLSWILMICATVIACTPTRDTGSDRLIPGVLPDTIRVATLYSPTSYFIYREEPMGLDYSLVKKMSEDKNMVLDIEVAPSLTAMLSMLDSGKVDLVAYPVPVTAEYREMVLACGPVNETHQVLVQPRRAHTPPISDVTQLPGHDVYVEKNSKYYYRMLNLNDELGGGITIHPIDRDTLVAEDAIEMVSSGIIPLTVTDSDIAQLNSTYYPNLDISLALSFPQRSAWAVSLRHKWLADSIDSWIKDKRPHDTHAQLLRRYFELSKADSPFDTDIDLSGGHISPFDDLFKHYASEIGFDWRLLASQGFVESHFDCNRISWAGARGIMQIMPGTARAYGSSPDNLVNAETCIRIASLILKDLDKSLSRYVTDKHERTKFILAAYNSGIAHIYDAIALADKLGYNPEVWNDNVSHCLLLKANPEYYNDPVCRFGYFRGRQTITYVDHVTSFYTRCKQYIKE